MREYEYDPEHQQESKAANDSLKSDAQAKRSQLEEWSATAYGEVCFAVPASVTPPALSQTLIIVSSMTTSINLTCNMNGVIAV